MEGLGGTVSKGEEEKETHPLWMSQSGKRDPGK